MVTTTSSIIKAYVPRPTARKEDSNNPYTLHFRKYPHIGAKYYRNKGESIKAKARDRYRNDPDYRERCKERAKQSYLRRKMNKNDSKNQSEKTT